ncbi:MAG: hypothetical protein AAB533_01165 [Patescibacteria group bacterium]
MEDQPALKAAGSLMEKSRFKRSTVESSNCELEIGEKKYAIELLDRSDHPDLAQVQTLFEQEFGEEEVDPEEVLRSAVEGRTPWGTKDLPYRVYALKDSEGRVLSALTGGLLDMRNADGDPTGETVFMVGYALTPEESRGKGFAREAYISALIGATAEAEEAGKKLSFAAGECTPNSERFWNNVGWKRVYAAESPGETKSYNELRYVQPALDFDTATGEVAEGAGESPEHLMIDSFNRMPPNKEQILETVQEFYRWCNLATYPREAFASDEAYQRQIAYVKTFQDRFQDELASSGQLIYLDQKSRSKATEKGVVIREYEEADHKEKSGEENF